MKISARDEDAARLTRRRVPAVKSGRGVKFQKTITINRPVAEVFSFWRNFENLSRFMKHVDSVIVRDATASHWAIKTEGTVLEWDAEIIEERQNEMIAWESLPGADVDNAGSIWFRPAVAGRGSVVKVAIKYAPTGGKLAAKVAKAFGTDAQSIIEDDLYRFKSLMETGEMPSTEGQPRGNQKSK